MPGVFGVHDPGMGEEELRGLASHMQLVLSHETWYQRQTTVQPPLAAGRVSLGLINTHDQPAGNEDRMVLVWMDGEIYDFQRRALTRQLQAVGHQLHDQGDAELLAHLYEDLGEACFDDLDGTFAVAIADRRQDKLLIAVDRDASRQMYFCAQDGRFLFATEVKAILQDRRVPRQLDEQGLVEFFTFRHPLGERTLVTNVHYLPAGSLAVYCRGQVHVRRYWEPRVYEDRPARPVSEYLDELAFGLRRALDRQLYDDRPVGEMLSGGLDSRLLVGLVPERVKGRFHTFTRGPLQCRDVQFGTMVAERIDSQHHTLELEPGFLPRLAKLGVWLTDGLMTVIDIYELSTIMQVKPYVEVVFLGHGRTDGILGGIELTKKLLQAQTLDEAARAFFAHQGTYISESLQAGLLPKRLYQETRGAALETLRQMLGTYQADSPATLAEAFCIQCRWPRSAMYGPALAHTQLEVRFPYSDNELSDLSCRVPARWRLKRQMEIALLKHVRPDLARVPYDYTGVPADKSTPAQMYLRRGLYYLRRRASGWTRGLISSGSERERANYPMWFRTTLRPWLEGVLLDKRTLDRGYYNEAYLRQMIADHMTNRRDYSIEFGLLLTFELWNRLFIDEDPAGYPMPDSPSPVTR